MQKRLDVAIVGAGPAGLATALYLHRAGHRVTLFERFEKPAPVGSGLILQPTGLTVLADLGLLADIMALGSRIDRLHGADAATGRTVLDVRYDALRGGRFGLAVHRAALFGVLHKASAAEGIPIETKAEVTSLDLGETAKLICEDGRSVGPFDLVVDASGARSRLRGHSQQPSEPKPLPYGALWASLRWQDDGFDQHALLQRYRNASVMIGVLPIGTPEPAAERMAAFFWSLKPEGLESLRSAGINAWKERVLGLWPDCAGLLDQIESFDQLTLARYGHHTLKMPVGRRFAVIGDAAHSTSPQLGQGANMALLDAAALAHAIETNAGIDSALATYAASRRLHVRAFQTLSRLFTPFYQSDSSVLPLLRDRLVATAAHLYPAPQLLASMVTGMMIDPFRGIGLSEWQWNAGGATQPAHLGAARPDPANLSDIS